MIQAADGTERSEWRKPPPDVAELKALIVELLDREGLSLVALNAALYAADKNDRVVAIRVQLRQRDADRVIWGSAVIKALAVGGTPFPLVDIAGGTAIDAVMVGSLALLTTAGMALLAWRRLH